MSEPWRLPFGATVEGDGVRFRVWAPAAASVDVVLLTGPDAERIHRLEAEGGGWWSARAPGVAAGARYRFRLDEADAYPDPASRSQPEGVHGPSAVVDPAAFAWSDAGWRGRPLEELVIYELHVGTATPEGTFDALIARLDDLAALGVTAIEPLPVAQFAGERNWGYDGVDLFAPAAVYGGPEGLRRLVDAAHARGIAVILDVVYNHLGPEGNYLPAITGGRFFTDRHPTPWGDGIAYDGPDAKAVRDFVIGNALHWAHEYHLDGLRLDATHAIRDDSPVHLLAELAERVRASLPADRHFVLIAEDERNERGLLLPRDRGGAGLDAVWADDFHHQLRVLTTGEREGYFGGFTGTTADLAATLRRGWFYEGQPTPDGTPRGTPADGLPPPAFVHCIQNHDQVGNRAFGERLNHLVEPAVYRAACALLLLSPYTPLLWMGQEWAASAPFLYFTHHPEELGRQVTDGRRSEFGGFSGFAAPDAHLRIPDPQDYDTFARSRLDWAERARMPHTGVLALHRELLRLRASDPALLRRGRHDSAAVPLGPHALALRRGTGPGSLLLVAVFAGEADVELCARPETSSAQGWTLVLSTEEGRFGGEAEGALARLDEDGRLTVQGPGGVLLRAAG